MIESKINLKFEKTWLRSRSWPLNVLNKNSSVQCQLLLICQNGRWVINREETQESPTEPVSFLNESLEHSFFNSQGKDLRDIWHVNWSVIEKRGKAPKNWAFRSFHAVEARSLDRGLRIVKNELKSSSPNAPEMRFSKTLFRKENYSHFSTHLLSGSSTRVFNHYTVEPQFLSHCKNTETVSSVNSPKTPQKHCPTCGRKYKLNVSFL